jgi:inner membrane protein
MPSNKEGMKMKFPLLARFLAICAVAALILIPIGMISSKISERQARANGVIEQFFSETSGPQLVVGPLLALTCEESYIDERQVMRGGKAETVSEKKTTACPTAYFSPRTFKAETSIPVKTLHRGIFSIRAYTGVLQLSGEFDWPEPPAPNGANPRIWKEVYIGSFVRDPRGVKAVSSDFPSHTETIAADSAFVQFPIRDYVGPYGARPAGIALPFNYKISLVGTSSLHVAPVGDRNEIQMSSDWQHPSFNAAWSPDDRSITPDGFKAIWRISSVATGGRAVWNKMATEGKLDEASGSGVTLFDPVNVYTLSYRATEYAFLFVLFTFSALALTEVLIAVRLHPIQYALVGSALAVFFLLLLALSERIAFDKAYLIAASGCVLLLTFYLRHPLGTWKRTTTFFSIFVALYTSLYFILVGEDNSLLLGSLLVFFLLAITMITTRKLDWARLSAQILASKNAAPTS